MHNPLVSCFCFFKMYQISCRFHIYSKKWRKNLFFLDNCSWIGSGKFSLLRREYLSSLVNVIANTPRISDTLRRTFSNSIFAKVIKVYDGSAVLQVFWLFMMLTLRRYSEKNLFSHLVYQIFRSLEFRKYRTCEGHVFF